MPDIIMHVNYFESGYALSESFDKARLYGYDGVELRGFRQDTPTVDYIREIRAEWGRTGLHHVIMACPCDLNNPSADFRAAEVEKCTDLLRQAAAIGVRFCNAMAGTLLGEGRSYMEFDQNGSGAATEDQWAWAVAGYQQLGAVAEELDMKLAFETHNCYLHDLAKPTAEFLRRIGSPAVGANLDMGNIVLNANGESVPQAIEALGDGVYYLHLKNLYLPPGGGYIVCPLSDGVIDNRLMLRLLQARGYAGPICLEEPRGGDRDHFARTDIEYIRGVLRDLAWV
jgi:sugar phosphate isomerase/epimerase